MIYDNVTEFKTKTQGFAHQLREVADSWHLTEWALWWEMGTGKSWVMIQTAGLLFDHNKIDTLVVVAPKGAYRLWEKEIDTHLSDMIQRDIVVWTSSKTKKKRELAQLRQDTPGVLKVFLVNIEALSSRAGENKIAKLIEGHRTMVVVDESTCIKNHKAKRTAALLRLTRQSSFRRCLSGTPADNNPLDLYSQTEFLAPRLLGFSSYFAMRARHANLKEIVVRVPVSPRAPTGRRKVTTVESYKRLDELHHKMKEFSSRVLKEECLDLPERVYMRRDVELTVEQRTLYRSLSEEGTARLKGESKVTPKMVLDTLLRLQQVTLGYVKDDEGEVRDITSNRYDAVLEVIEEAGGKVVISSGHIHCIEKLLDVLSDAYGAGSVVSLYGATKDRTEAVRRLQEDDATRYCVMNPAVGGYGWTMHAAGTMILFSNSFKLAERMQAEARIHRAGMPDRHATYVDLVAEGTIDARVIDALRNKKSVADQVVGDEWKEWI